jgi:hypothetical protein
VNSTATYVCLIITVVVVVVRMIKPRMMRKMGHDNTQER